MDAVAEMYAELHSEESPAGVNAQITYQYKVRSPSGCFIGYVNRATYNALPNDWELLAVHTTLQHDELPF